MGPEPAARVTLEATVSPSEDREKVIGAMRQVVSGDLTLDDGPTRIRARADGPQPLQKLHDQLRDRHVRGAARRLLLSNSKGDSATFMVNRQAAAAGVIALCGTPDESPLGPIYVTIQSRRFVELIDWLTAYEEG